MIPESVLWNFLQYFLFLIYLFIYGCCEKAFSNCARVGDTFHCSVQASYCGGFSSLSGAQAPGMWMSVVEAYGLVAFGDLSSWTRVQTQISCIGRQVPNHWTTRKVLSCITSSHVGNFSKLSSHTTTTWEEPVHRKWPWYGEGLRAGAEWSDRGWDD